MNFASEASRPQKTKKLLVNNVLQKLGLLSLKNFYSCLEITAKFNGYTVSHEITEEFGVFAAKLPQNCRFSLQNYYEFRQSFLLGYREFR